MEIGLRFLRPKSIVSLGRSGGLRCGLERELVQLIDVEVHDAVVDLDIEALRAAGVRRLGAAVIETDGPVVQRASDAFAEHDALAQGPTLVRAAVEQREHLVLGIAKDRDRGRVLARDAARAEHRDVGDGTDGFPVAHASPNLEYMPVTSSITCKIRSLVVNTWLMWRRSGVPGFKVCSAASKKLHCISASSSSDLIADVASGAVFKSVCAPVNSSRAFAISAFDSATCTPQLALR